MTATRTLNLKLPKRYPRKRRQNLRGFAMARFPDELLVIPTAITGKRLLFASHQKFPIPNQDLLDKIPQKRGKENGKNRQDGDNRASGRVS